MAKRKSEDGSEDVAPDTAAAVADAEAKLAEASKAHADAVEAHRVANLPNPELGKHILVEGVDGSHSLVDAPKGYSGESPDRVVNIGGSDYHHVSDHASGVWIYRKV